MDRLFGLLAFRPTLSKTTMISSYCRKRCLAPVLRASFFSRGPKQQQQHLLRKQLRPCSTSSADKPSTNRRIQLLEAALSKVVEHGWTDAAIVAAAGDSLSMAGLVSVEDMVVHCMDQLQRALQQELEEKEWDESCVVVDKLTWALQRRLDLNKELMLANRWHEAMALGAQPSQMLQTKQQLKSLIDCIVDSIEPKMVQVERIGLGVIYVATELHYVSDPHDATATEEFLRQRLIEWDQLRRLNFGGSTGADVMWTASQVSSAIVSGVQSMMMTTNTSSPSDWDRRKL